MTKPIPRSENSETDELAKAAAQGITLTSDVFYEVINQPSIELNIKTPKPINAIHNEEWRAPIMAYLKGYHEPKTKEEEKGCSRGHKGIESSMMNYTRLA